MPQIPVGSQLPISELGLNKEKLNSVGILDSSLGNYQVMLTALSSALYYLTLEMEKKKINRDHNDENLYKRY
jgi:hypothetical protein